MNLFTRAAKGLSLNPAERAILKLAWGLLWTAVVAGLTAGGQFLGTHSLSNPGLVAQAAAAAFLVAFLNALGKLLSARGDAPLATAIQFVAGELQTTLAPEANVAAHDASTAPAPASVLPADTLPADTLPAPASASAGV